MSTVFFLHDLPHGPAPFDQAAAWCRGGRGTSSLRSCCGLAFCSVLHGKRKGKHVEKLKNVGNIREKKHKS